MQAAQPSSATSHHGATLRRSALLTRAACRAVAEFCVGFSGRTLRKLPFLALAHADEATSMSCRTFIGYLLGVADQEKRDRALLVQG